MNNTKVLNWIDGLWLDSGDYKDSIAPATYELIGRYAEGGLAEAQQGIDAAQRAFTHTP